MEGRLNGLWTDCGISSELISRWASPPDVRMEESWLLFRSNRWLVERSSTGECSVRSPEPWSLTFSGKQRGAPHRTGQLCLENAFTLIEGQPARLFFTFDFFDGLSNKCRPTVQGFLHLSDRVANSELRTQLPSLPWTPISSTTTHLANVWR